MGRQLPAVDAYIQAAPVFARPILKRVRRAFHAGCPEVEETIKWGAPCFSHRGLLGGMSAFKAHAGFGFFRAKEMADPKGLFGGDPKGSMMNVRVERLSELPKQSVLVAYVHEAKRLNELPREAATKHKPAPKPMPPLPIELAQALKRHPSAASALAALTQSCRREFITYVHEAKKPETRERRAARTLEYLERGLKLYSKATPARRR